MSLVLLGRPLFLVGGFLLYALGVWMALANGAGLSLLAWLWGQLVVTATQLMTHYSNDYFDLAADRVNPNPTRWAGGSSMLTAGRLSSRTALQIATVFGLLGLAAALALALALRPNPLALLLMLGAMALAWGYSAPPFQLHSRGLGEATVALILVLLTPSLGYVLQAGRLESGPLLALVPLAGLQFAMMLVLGLPDAAGDAAAGKRTLVVRLGPAGAVRLHNWVLLASYLVLPFLVLVGLPPLVGLMAALSGPVAWWHGRRLASGAWSEPDQWNSLSFWGIGLLVATAAAELVAFIWIFQSR